MVIKMKKNHYREWVKIGLNIAYYRKERGLTQLDLAEMSDISRNHLQKVETGNGSASVDTLFNIASALNIPVVKLFEFRD